MQDLSSMYLERVTESTERKEEVKTPTDSLYFKDKEKDTTDFWNESSGQKLHQVLI